MFEPTPPPAQQTRKFLKSRNSQYRRTLSAHGRIGTPTEPENNRTHNDIIKQRTVLNKTRPRSAVETGQKKNHMTSTSSELETTTAGVTYVPNQILTLNVTQSDCGETTSGTSGSSEEKNSPKKSLQVSSEKGKKGTKGRSIPEGIMQLAPWLTEDVPIEL